jgi:hypothetical protein
MEMAAASCATRAVSLPVATGFFMAVGSWQAVHGNRFLKIGQR